MWELAEHLPRLGCSGRHSQQHLPLLGRATSRTQTQRYFPTRCPVQSASSESIGSRQPRTPRSRAWPRPPRASSRSSTGARRAAGTRGARVFCLSWIGKRKTHSAAGGVNWPDGDVLCSLCRRRSKMCRNSFPHRSISTICELVANQLARLPACLPFNRASQPAQAVSNHSCGGKMT